MLAPSLTSDAFARLVAEARAAGHDGRLAVPVYRTRSADLLTPVAAFLALREPGGFGFLLESVEGGERLGRYSFLGRRPYAVLEARGRETVRFHPDASGDGAALERLNGTIHDELARALDATHEVRIPGLPRFTGGAVGCMGYDTVRLLEHLPCAPPDDLGTPDALWAFYDAVVVFDHVTHRMRLVATAFVEPGDDLDAAFRDAQRRLDTLDATLAAGPARSSTPVSLRADEPVSNVARADFEAAVRQAQHHIVEGDIFQVVLSQRFAMPFEGDPFGLYRALRQVNPSPYLFFLDFAATDGTPVALAGSSPEVLVRVEDGAAEVLPIAGTRPRGETPAEDAALADDLTADPKERAEHLMLVDLGRNDLGRVCAPGSVRVADYARIERYARVMHLVSSVTGSLDAAHSGLDALAACFPAGTVSGAPKVRAMELIDQLETSRRGIYAGAVGYADFSGNTDTCIAIRTIVVRPSPEGSAADAPLTAYVQAGAGIVADSRPEAEFEETRAKARALLDALRTSAHTMD